MNTDNWISVTDWLPEPNQRVICFEQGLVFIGWFVDDHDYEFNDGLIWVSEPSDLDPTNVTFWQPLPLPPAEQT